jgi:hypothetical protein
MNPANNRASDGPGYPLIFWAALDDNLRQPMWLPAQKSIRRRILLVFYVAFDGEKCQP